MADADSHKFHPGRTGLLIPGKFVGRNFGGSVNKYLRELFSMLRGVSLQRPGQQILSRRPIEMKFASFPRIPRTILPP